MLNKQGGKVFLIIRSFRDTVLDYADTALIQSAREKTKSCPCKTLRNLDQQIYMPELTPSVLRAPLQPSVLDKADARVLLSSATRANCDE